MDAAAEARSAAWRALVTTRHVMGAVIAPGRACHLTGPEASELANVVSSAGLAGTSADRRARALAAARARVTLAEAAYAQARAELEA